MVLILQNLQKSCFLNCAGFYKNECKYFKVFCFFILGLKRMKRGQEREVLLKISFIWIKYQSCIILCAKLVPGDKKCQKIWLLAPWFYPIFFSLQFFSNFFINLLIKPLVENLKNSRMVLNTHIIILTTVFLKKIKYHV